MSGPARVGCIDATDPALPCGQSSRQAGAARPWVRVVRRAAPGGPGELAGGTGRAGMQRVAVRASRRGRSLQRGRLAASRRTGDGEPAAERSDERFAVLLSASDELSAAWAPSHPQLMPSSTAVTSTGSWRGVRREISGGDPMKAREPLQPRALAAATGSDRYWVLGLSAVWSHGCRSTEKNLGRAAARQGPSRV